MRAGALGAVLAVARVEHWERIAVAFAIAVGVVLTWQGDFMAQDKSSATVSKFLATLPPERRGDVDRVRGVIRRYLPAGYEEVVSKNMLVYQVPFDRYSDTYNGQPLWYAALASEKSYLSLHLMPIYGDKALAQRLDDGFRAAGKKVNRGKACIRFAKADDLALDVIAEIVGAIPLDRWVEISKASKRR